MRRCSDSERLGAQREGEAGPAVRRVADREFTALGAGKIAGDGEAQARAPALPRPGGLGGVEAVEDARQVLGGDAGATIRFTVASIRPLRTRHSTVTSPSGGVNRRALSSRTVRIWPVRPSSPRAKILPEWLTLSLFPSAAARAAKRSEVSASRKAAPGTRIVGATAP